MMTIECPKCQIENPDDTAFCGKCGNGKAIEHYEKFLPLWKAADTAFLKLMMQRSGWQLKSH